MSCTLDLSDISFLLSGGASNTDPAQSLGGVISFKKVSLGEYFSDMQIPLGSSTTDYSCIYIRNDSDKELTLLNVFIFSETDDGANVSIGFGGSKNATAFEIFNPVNIPPSVVFNQPTSDSPLSVTNLESSDFISLWFKRTVLNNALSLSNDSVTIGLSGTWDCSCQEDCEGGFSSGFSLGFETCP